MNEQRQYFSWVSPKVEIRETKKYGKGVFAIEDIGKDEEVMVMGGYILTIDDENNLKGVAEDKPIEISDKFSIGPRNEEDLEKMPQHFINHSCEPNLGFKGQLFIVAMRDIKKGEEISYDYAMVMNSNEDSSTYFKMKCLCGSTDCRNEIAEDDWKILELQKKYDGYFQWFLQDKINKNKK